MSTPIRVSAETMEALIEASEKYHALLAELMPTEQHALQVMDQAYTRLKDLGFDNAVYAPKNGTPFDAIEVGSTGIFDCHYSGEWPKGTFFISDGDDFYPSRPSMYRLKQK